MRRHESAVDRVDEEPGRHKAGVRAALDEGCAFTGPERLRDDADRRTLAVGRQVENRLATRQELREVKTTALLLRCGDFLRLAARRRHSPDLPL